jgi:diacylglycerol kinase (ATP)
VNDSEPGFSIAKRLLSFRYAWAGLRYFIVTEHNSWLHLAATFAAIALSATLGLGANEWLWIITAIGWVWTAEAFNTAIERLADAVTLERNETIKAAKDVAAAGVLVSAVTAFLIGLIIFYPHLRSWAV